jgi:hypothetical protein
MEVVLNTSSIVSELSKLSLRVPASLAQMNFFLSYMLQLASRVSEFSSHREVFTGNAGGFKGARTASESTTPRKPSRYRHMEAIRE